VPDRLSKAACFPNNLMKSDNFLMPKFHIVLVEPKIPPNTGSIARLAVGVGATLHLVGKLGFSTDERSLKRAGLDYWKYLDLYYHDSLDELHKQYPNGRFLYATKKTKRLYTELDYLEGDFIVFGSETSGLSSDVLKKHADSTILIPMTGPMRSLNLSNAVSVVAYELIRQLTKA